MPILDSSLTLSASSHSKLKREKYILESLLLKNREKLKRRIRREAKKILKSNRIMRNKKGSKSSRRKTSVEEKKNGESCQRKIEDIVIFKTPLRPLSCVSRTTLERVSLRARNMPFLRKEWVVIKANGYISTSQPQLARNSSQKCARPNQRHYQISTISILLLCELGLTLPLSTQKIANSSLNAADSCKLTVQLILLSPISKKLTSS